MQGLKRAARACAVAACATLVAAPAFAAEPEPWPPSTPPGGVDPPPSTPPGGVDPLPSMPPGGVDPPPSTAAPEGESPASLAAAPPSAAPDTGLTLVSPAAPRRRSFAFGGFGSKDGQLFFHTSGDEIVLFPSGRLETDAFDLITPDPFTSGQTLLIDRARLDLAGWVGSKVYFELSADFAYGVSARHADDYVAIAPWGDRAILQVGQFDAPFTLENRTPDRYLDLFARGPAVRAFAIPDNKDQGVMVHGVSPAGSFYYSAAVMNGQGPAVTGVSSQPDVMARAWVAPFSSRGPRVLHDLTVGGSAWTGRRSGDLAFQGQQTPGGYTFVMPNLWWWAAGRTDAPVLRQEGRLEAGALELNAPLSRRIGARAEWIAKRQPLEAFDTSRAPTATPVGGLTLSGWSGYAEIWGWAIGSDRLLGRVAAPGLELPLRYADLSDADVRGGLMLSARVDRIDETLTADPATNLAGVGVASAGHTTVTAYTVGGSYWFTRRARLLVNYVLTRVGGVTPWLNGLGGDQEQEVLGRLALAL